MSDYVWLTTLEDRDARAAQEAAQVAQIEQVTAVMARVKDTVSEEVKAMKEQIKALNKAHNKALNAALDKLATCERQRDDLQAVVDCHAQAMRLWESDLRRRIFDAAFACRGGDARTALIAENFQRAISGNEEARAIALAELKDLARNPEAVIDGEFPAGMTIHDSKEFVPGSTKNSKSPNGFAKSR